MLFCLVAGLSFAQWRIRPSRSHAWNGLVTDIDDRKRAEEALRSSERNLSLLINAIPTFIHVLRTDGSVLYVNPMVLDYTGLTLEDVQKEGYRARHPEDVERLREERQQALTRPIPFENEQRVLGKDGKYRWFLVRFNPLLDEQGRIDRWYAAATDIEDLKRAEQELKRSEAFLAEGQRLSRTGSFSWCVETDEITWSEEMYRIFGFDERLPVTLERIAGRVYPDDLPLMQDMIQQARQAASDFEYKHRLLMPDQSVKHVHLFAHATRDQNGRLEYVGAAQDVTRQEEERARKENVRLEERTRIAQELHDTLLQTFLSASMQLDIALDHLPSESSAKALLVRILEIMHRGIEEGRSTIKGLRSSDSDPTDLVKALTGVRQELPVRQDIAFSVSGAGRPQPLSPVIQQETYRIGREALLNAFCHSGAKRVECELEYADQDLQMRVRDNGVGIDPQVLHNGREGHWGLAGMRERAAKIGGLLNISSSASTGTEVRLSVPSRIAFQVPAKAKSACNRPETF
jgi:PAS domain S-box-containing protein